MQKPKSRLAQALDILKDAPLLSSDLADELGISIADASDSLSLLYQHKRVKRRPFNSPHTQCKYLYFLPRHQPQPKRK